MNRYPSLLIHSTFNRMLCVFVWVLCGLMLVSAGFGGIEPLVRSAPVIALAAYFAWLALWRPYLSVIDDAVVLGNVFRTITVPWQALIHVDTKFALTLVTPRGRFAAWVAPAPGAFTTRRLARQSRKSADPADGELRPQDPGIATGDLAGSDSGDAARVIRQRWTAQLEAGVVEAGQADSTPVTVAWQFTPLVVTAVLAALTVVAVVV